MTAPPSPKRAGRDGGGERVPGQLREARLVVVAEVKILGAGGTWCARPPSTDKGFKSIQIYPSDFRQVSAGAGARRRLRESL